MDQRYSITSWDYGNIWWILFLISISVFYLGIFHVSVPSDYIQHFVEQPIEDYENGHDDEFKKKFNQLTYQVKSFDFGRYRMVGIDELPLFEFLERQQGQTATNFPPRVYSPEIRRHVDVVEFDIW